MSELYVECLVKKDESTLGKFLKILLIMLAAVFAVMGLMMIAGGLPLLLAFAAGVGAYFVSIYTKVEYEYLYLDKELSIDKIYGQTKRKKVATYELERMEIIAPFHSHRVDMYKNRNVTVKDYSIGREEKPDLRYSVYYEGNIKLVLSPNEELIKALRNAAPRKVFTD